MSRKSEVIKQCQMCKQEKSLSDYHRNQTKSDAHNGICKECQKIVNNKEKK